MGVRTLLQRLLRYPHRAVFDKSPDSELVLRIRHASGCTWTVADEVLTVRTGAGATFTYDLPRYLLQSLAADLADDGFEVAYLSPTMRKLSAAVLVEGSGDQAKSNGDHLRAFRSVLWVILSAHARELRALGVAKEQALRQMVIPQAEDYWLDVWGMLYGIGRDSGELDSRYAARIPKEAFRIRVNAIAIEKAIKDLTGKDVQIREPWRELFRLDRSKLSGKHHLYDGKRWGYHLLQPVAAVGMVWDDVMRVIHRNRAAGVLVLPPLLEFADFVDGTLPGAVWFGGSRQAGWDIAARRSLPLGEMVLDVDGLIRNYALGDTPSTTDVMTVPALDSSTVSMIGTGLQLDGSWEAGGWEAGSTWVGIPTPMGS